MKGLLAAMALWMGLCAAFALAEEQKLEATFAKGKAQGNLKVSYEGCTLEPKSDHLVLDQPGKSQLRAMLPLQDRSPGRVFVAFETRMPETGGAADTILGGGVVYSLFVNNEPIVEKVLFHLDTYTSVGHDIARAVQSGDNRIELRLLPESVGSLWVRRVTVTRGTGRWIDWLPRITVMAVVLFLCPWWFELFWLNGRGADPRKASWGAMIITLLLLYPCYRFSTGVPFHLALAAGAVLFLLLVMWATRLRH